MEVKTSLFFFFKTGIIGVRRAFRLRECPLTSLDFNGNVALAPGGREGGGDSPIKLTGVLVVPFRGYNLSIGTA